MNTHTSAIAAQVPEDLIPQSVKDATLYRDAADDFLAQVTTRKEVDLHAATEPGDLAKILKAATSADPSPEEIATARQLAQIAAERLEQAWTSAIYSEAIYAHFRDGFDQAAADLTEELDSIVQPAAQLIAEHWNPDGARLRDTCQELARLSEIRDHYAYLSNRAAVTDLCSNEYERTSRTAWFDSFQNEMYFRQRVAGLSSRHPNYWVTLAGWDGAHIKWQTAAEQAAQPDPAKVARNRNTMAAHAASFGH